MDAQVGRVLDSLRSTGTDENTIVVFASDNGPVTSRWLQWYEVNAHGSTGGLKGRKHFLHEGGIRVPAIIRYPGVTQANAVTDEPVSGIDLFTTLVKLAGATIPSDRPIDGMDISGVLAGGNLEQRTLFWALPAPNQLEFAVRRGDWKLLLNTQLEARELYNLTDDPLELLNQIEQQPRNSRRLRNVFMRIRSSIKTDPLRPKG
jgi:arylsulfatase A